MREEVTFIYQKLRECPEPTARRGGPSAALAPLSPLPPTEAQEDEITENLMNIQKVRKTQVKCRKVSGEDGTLWELGAGGISVGLLRRTGAGRSGFKSQLCHLPLCDCGQTTSSLWASVSPSI